MRLITLLLTMVLASTASAHQLTPTYFKLEQTVYGPDIYGTMLKLFNAREEVDFYQIGVYDNNWEPVMFATQSQVVRVPYMTVSEIPILIRAEDVERVTYVCTDSKILKNSVTSSGIKTRICSKVGE